MIAKLPYKVVVDRLLHSRYPDNERPLSWENRAEGNDTVMSASGEKIKLLSDGGQTPPKMGWTIILTDGSPSMGYRWTLYSYPKTTTH